MRVEENFCWAVCGVNTRGESDRERTRERELLIQPTNFARRLNSRVRTHTHTQSASCGPCYCFKLCSLARVAGRRCRRRRRAGASFEFVNSLKMLYQVSALRSMRSADACVSMIA